jgi:hypothetical protein
MPASVSDASRSASSKALDEPAWFLGGSIISLTIFFGDLSDFRRLALFSALYSEWIMSHVLPPKLSLTVFQPFVSFVSP